MEWALTTWSTAVGSWSARMSVQSFVTRGRELWGGAPIVTSAVSDR